jgi:hypothetical protein
VAAARPCQITGSATGCLCVEAQVKDHLHYETRDMSGRCCFRGGGGGGGQLAWNPTYRQLAATHLLTPSCERRRGPPPGARLPSTRRGMVNKTATLRLLCLCGAEPNIFGGLLITKCYMHQSTQRWVYLPKKKMLVCPMKRQNLFSRDKILLILHFVSD